MSPKGMRARTVLASRPLSAIAGCSAARAVDHARRVEVNEAQLPCPSALGSPRVRPCSTSHRSPRERCPVFAPAQGRALSLAVALLGLSGCLAHQEPSRSWLVYAREVPVARVTLAGASHGNVVDVAVNGGAAEVTLRHQGQATLSPVKVPPGMKVALREVDVGALARGDFEKVERALEEAPLNHDDDVARDILRATADEELARALQSERGRSAVAQLYSALTADSLWDDEREQARRVLMAYAQRIGPERFARAIEDEGTKVVPLRGFGLTVWSPVSVRVELASDGLDVTLNSKVYDYPERQTLGAKPSHFHVGYDEVVGVRLYDENGAIRFAPALYLLEVAHQDARHTLLKCGEAFTFGVTLGAGGAVGVAGGRLATALMWCDRVAVALGAVTSVVDEHRAWILEKYGEKGARFLRYSDGLFDAGGLLRRGEAGHRCPQGAAQPTEGLPRHEGVEGRAERRGAGDPGSPRPEDGGGAPGGGARRGRHPHRASEGPTTVAPDGGSGDSGHRDGREARPGRGGAVSASDGGQRRRRRRKQAAARRPTVVGRSAGDGRASRQHRRGGSRLR